MHEKTIAQLSAGLAAGEFGSEELTRAFLGRIERFNPALNAFITVTAESALAQARAADQRRQRGAARPLTGVPIAHKDIFCTDGVRTSCGSRMLDRFIAPYNATAVERLNAAGAVMLGKTNMDEFAMGSSTENSAFGPTRNPHDVTRVPGGSSGGSAAAVAAGFAPVSLGSDTGGSIRQPAALCGVVGVKPTYGTVSRLGLVAFGSSLDQIGPFSATVADAARVLEVIGGHDPGDSTSLPGSFPSVSEHLDDGVSGLRVGIVTEMMGDGIAADVTARVRAAADALAAAGATVEEVSVPAVTYGLSAYYLVAPAEASSNLARYDGVRYGVRVEAATAGEMMEATRTAGFGDEVKRRIMLGTYALSAGYYDAFYGKALKVRTLIRRDFDAAYERVDVLLSPTSPTTAFPFGDKTADPMAMYLNDVCTIPTNLAGHPAMSVPFGVGDDGLPVGVQVLAPALGEVVMFRAAAVLEGSVR